jgi:uncharacterized membrane protein (GlpM family)
MSQASGEVKAEPRRVIGLAWWEYAVRFVFGGIVTVIAGLIAHQYGPAVGGLFLAFPAIFPASTTLVDKHSGKEKARATTSGSVIGSVGLLGFGAAVWLLAGRLPPWQVLAIALVAWLVLAFGLWGILRRLRSLRALQE